MAGLERLEIDDTVAAHISAEQLIAQQATVMLHSYGMVERTLVGTTWFERPVSDTYEPVCSNAAEVSVRFLATIALAGKPSMAAASVGRSCAMSDHTTSAEYDVIEMQISKTKAGYENPIWKPYVLMVTEKEDIDNVTLLNANTGHELDLDDVMYLERIVKTVHNEYTYTNAESIIEDGDTAVRSYETGAFGLTIEFDPEGFEVELEKPAATAAPEFRDNANLN